MAQRHFPRGLDNRMRDRYGEIRQKKRGGVHLLNLHEEYGEDFLPSYRLKPPPEIGRQKKGTSNSPK